MRQNAERKMRGEQKHVRIRKVVSEWILKVMFAAGMFLLCWPFVSNILHGYRQQAAVSTMEEIIAEKDTYQLEKERVRAEAYNRALISGAGSEGCKLLRDENYSSILNQYEGIMGSIEIPKIGVDLPVAHGTSEAVLSAGAGHQQGTSLPVGGESTHCVLTGHRGLPGSKLFTRLDEMEKGDLFYLRVLGEVLAYQTTEIRVVRPEETEVLEIRPGGDICSLITCTPYGLNTHRLVVTGIRVPYEEKKYVSIEEELPSLRESVITALPFILAGTAAAVKIRDRRNKSGGKKKHRREKNISGKRRGSKKSGYSGNRRTHISCSCRVRKRRKRRKYPCRS